MHTEKPIRPQIGADPPPRKAYCAFLAGQGASFLLGHNVRLVNSQKAGLEAAPHTAC